MSPPLRNDDKGSITDLDVLHLASISVLLLLAIYCISTMFVLWRDCSSVLPSCNQISPAITSTTLPCLYITLLEKEKKNPPNFL